MINSNMKKILIILLFNLPFCLFAQQRNDKKYPAFWGNFSDDYGSKYTISKKNWRHHGNGNYHILKWNYKKQYILLKNDENNLSAAGKYTRIDYMEFKEMENWTWGYCYTIYNAENKRIALKKAKADRQNPKKGCNGYPFSRMKKENIDQI
jgi:hypothetical protein